VKRWKVRQPRYSHQKLTGRKKYQHQSFGKEHFSINIQYIYIKEGPYTTGKILYVEELMPAHHIMHAPVASGAGAPLFSRADDEGLLSAHQLV
jgi:hypothetical protein